MAPSHSVAGGPLRSQLVAVPTEDGVASLAGRQLLEGALWRAAGRFSARFLLGGEVGRGEGLLVCTVYRDYTRYPNERDFPADLSGGAVCGIGAVMELSVKLPGVKVQHKLPQFAFNTEKEQGKETTQKGGMR